MRSIALQLPFSPGSPGVLWCNLRCCQTDIKHRAAAGGQPSAAPANSSGPSPFPQPHCRHHSQRRHLPELCRLTLLFPACVSPRRAVPASQPPAALHASQLGRGTRRSFAALPSTLTPQYPCSAPSSAAFCYLEVSKHTSHLVPFEHSLDQQHDTWTHTKHSTHVWPPRGSGRQMQLEQAASCSASCPGPPQQPLALPAS